MTTTDRPLPGEDSPIQWHGERRGPITDDEALGTARRLARRTASRGRADLTNAAPPSELPDPDSKRVMVAFRLRPLDVMFARTRAELQNQTLTSAIDDLLESYGRAEPGSVAVWVRPEDIARG